MEPTPPSSEPPASEEIVIPTDVMKPFAKALNARVKPALEEMQTGLSKLDPNQDADIRELMQAGQKNLSQFFDKLEKAREVKIKSTYFPQIKATEYELLPSLDDEEFEIPTGDKTLNADLTKRVASGLHHYVNSQLNIFTLGEEVFEKQAAPIRSGRETINSIVTEIQTADHVEITTTSQGSTYTAIPRT